MADGAPSPPLEQRKTRRAATGSTAVGRGADGGGPGGLAFGSRSLAALVAAVLVATVLVSAVVGLRDNDDSEAAASPSTSTPAAVAAPTECEEVDDIPAADGKPTDIEVPAEPVSALRVQDLEKGDGATATAGSRVSVQYVGVSCASGRQFDASWDRGEPLDFTLGQREVIPGWEQGIDGMQVGGRRLLWIPADLGYGEEGRPPDIAPSDTLIFVVDLEKIG